MEEFNKKLRCEKNNTIDGGINLGAEFFPITITILPSTPLIGRILGGEIVKLPGIGIEYFRANSKYNRGISF